MNTQIVSTSEYRNKRIKEIENRLSEIDQRKFELHNFKVRKASGSDHRAVEYMVDTKLERLEKEAEKLMKELESLRAQ